MAGRLDMADQGTTTVYVSITGLQLKRWWHFFTFLRHTIPASRQARKAEGNLRTELTRVNGVYHTLTVWRSKADMQAYIYSGAHLEAIRAFNRFATGKTFGFETDQPPRLSEVHELWLKHGKEYAAELGSGQE